MFSLLSYTVEIYIINNNSIVGICIEKILFIS